tara:strand:- start:119 stop:562 length:444 start_codon:yes stop_codon:yes gene_type:complete
MKKFNFLFLIFLLTSVSYSLFSKTMFLKCDTLFFKITEPLVGFTKAYIIEESKWSKIKKLEVTDNSYILKNIYPNQSKCNNNKCRVNIKLEKNSEEISYLRYKSVVNNEFCNIDGGNNCYKRKIGKNLEAGYCSKIKNKDISLDGSN